MIQLEAIIKVQDNAGSDNRRPAKSIAELLQIKTRNAVICKRHLNDTPEERRAKANMEREDFRLPTERRSDQLTSMHSDLSYDN